MSNEWLDAICKALVPLAEPARAKDMAAYMRQQFTFLGIRTPDRRKAVAGWIGVPMARGALLDNARALWSMPEREYQYVAVDLLKRQHKRLTLDDVHAVLDLVQGRSWWDTVDGLAGVVGNVVREGRGADGRGQAMMDAALRHGNMWVRRVAMLHQLGWRQDTDCERLFAYALMLAGEQDFFIRKAIGWALRDYARTAPEAVAAFLDGGGKGLSPLSRREAAKHLGGMQGP